MQLPFIYINKVTIILTTVRYNTQAGTDSIYIISYAELVSNTAIFYTVQQIPLVTKMKFSNTWICTVSYSHFTINLFLIYLKNRAQYIHETRWHCSTDQSQLDT